jgi:hypothetical protein
LRDGNNVAQSWEKVHVGDIVEFVGKEKSVWDHERISVKHLKTNDILCLNYQKNRPYYGAYSGKNLLEEI